MKLKDIFDKIFKKEKQEENQPQENTNQDILNELNSLTLDKQTLMLEKIDRESETIKRYLDELTSDLSKNKTEIHNSISVKIRKMTIHGLELRNLLTSLETHYFEPLIDILKRLQERVHRIEIDTMLQELNQDYEIIVGLEKQLGILITYDELFNPEKNPEYKKAIDKELDKKILHIDIKDLINKILKTVLDKTENVKRRIEHSNIVERAKFIT